MTTPTLSDLGREVREIRDKYPRLEGDQAFLVWFLQAFGGASQEAAIAALPGRTGDKGADAVFVDEDLRIVFVIQAKYRRSLMKKAEARNDVLGLVRVGAAIAGPQRQFTDFCATIDVAARQKLRGARERVLRRGYRLQLCFVTTGKCSTPLEREARREAQAVRLRQAESATFVLYDGNGVIDLLGDWLEGAAPPPPSLDIQAEGGDIMRRRDAATNIDLRVLWVNGGEIARIYEGSGPRVFHRNVRGFLGLGDSAINREMMDAISTNSRQFLYLNNGVTIVCDEARREEDLLSLRNPQIINGQQTTRVLHEAGSDANRVAVQVRVIEVPPSARRAGIAAYEELVGDIVRATNRQNAIKPSDLKSNDRIQVLLERELQKLHYEYVRKRQAKREARTLSPQSNWVVTKIELAKAAAATLSEGLPRRIGREQLFEMPYYKRIFRSSDPRFYLTRYWLMRAVDTAARGSGERQWAKYVVLYFLWQELGRDIRRRQDTFIRARETSKTPGRLERYLNRAVESAFRATGKFFRTTRGTGMERLEVSPFYKRKDVYERFEKYWASRANKQRPIFRKAVEAFLGELELA